MLLLTAVVILLASGIAAGSIMRSERLVTFIAATGALFEVHWLLIALVHREFFIGASIQLVFFIGALFFLSLWLTQIRKWRGPGVVTKQAGAELAVLVVLVAVLGSAWVVGSVNGFIGSNWVTHGFYNGDTATFISLVQRSQITDGLLKQNPFAGNGDLEYPTLLHGAVADWFTQAGIIFDWVHFLPFITLAQLVITIPLFFLLGDLFLPKSLPANTWLGVSNRGIILALEAGIVLYILMLAWDNYIYPQSHFFLTNLFLWQICLLVAANKFSLLQARLAVAIAGVTTLVLLLANAVTGTAATIAWLVFCGGYIIDRRQTVATRSRYLGAAVLTGILFVVVMPGNAAFGLPHFSYTAALDMLRLAPVVLLLLAGIWLQLGRHHYLAVVSVALCLAAVFTFLFSTRNIIVENASRFMYHALLAGFPLLLLLIVRGWFLCRRLLLLSTRSPSEWFIGIGSVVVLFAIFSLPAGSSVLSAFDHLLFKDQQAITLTDRLALEWIQDHTAADAIFLSSPQPPWSIPIFTGRTLLRTAYWLSPEDELGRTVEAAFSGDRGAQAVALSHADYLVLTAAQQELWALPPLEPAYHSPELTIYSLK
ncbi:MAG: hypothetical protein WEA04_00245 [Candidatus Andersenbacteria bacterium]